jgi:hypothetical protein
MSHNIETIYLTNGYVQHELIDSLVENGRIPEFRNMQIGPDHNPCIAMFLPAEGALPPIQIYGPEPTDVTIFAPAQGAMIQAMFEQSIAEQRRQLITNP